MLRSLRIWTLIDDRPGTAAQALGVAEKLGLPFETKTLSYNRLAALPNFLRGASLIGVDNAPSLTLPLKGEESEYQRAGGGGVPCHEPRAMRHAPRLTPPWPDIVISAGRRAAPVARYIKKQNPSCRLVQIMRPGFPLKYFDLVALPQHDLPSNQLPITNHPSLLTTLLTPHRLTKEAIAAAMQPWHEKFARFDRPRVALFIGGDSKGAYYTQEDYTTLFRLASAQAAGGALLISASRRTGAEVEMLANSHVTVPYYFYKPSQGDNPYLALLGLSDKIIVTGDSMSMISEACFIGKPVFIFSPRLISPKYTRLHRKLFDQSWAAALMAGSTPIVPRSQPPDAALGISKAIRERWVEGTE